MLIQAFIFIRKKLLKKIMYFRINSWEWIKAKKSCYKQYRVDIFKLFFWGKKGYIWPRVEGSVRKKRVSVLQASLAIQQCCCHNVMFSCLNMATVVFPYTFSVSSRQVTSTTVVFLKTIKCVPKIILQVFGSTQCQWTFVYIMTEDFMTDSIL